MKSNLGRWAVIDIETSGIHPDRDSIIDIGYILFEGQKKIKEYSSLVRYPQRSLAVDETIPPLSYFIQNLTGISAQSLKSAPSFEMVCEHFEDLKGATLIAHNSEFESSFLKEHLDPDHLFIDSIDFLAILNPEKNSLSLESFIVEEKIREREEHRGLSDSLDLLKILLLSLDRLQNDRPLFFTLEQVWKNYGLENHWWRAFCQLSNDEMKEIGEAIHFDIEKHQLALKKSIQDERKLDQDNLEQFSPPSFSAEGVQTILRNEKHIQKYLPRYRYRLGQEQMALRVGQSFKNNVHAVIQAPTGIGKTLGYLVPGFLYAKNFKEQVLLATGTKALQHQVFKEDMPKVRKIFNWHEADLKVAILVGTQNHFCELLFRSKQKDKMDDFNNLFSSKVSDSERFSWAFFEVLFYKQKENNFNITVDKTPQVLKYRWKEYRDLHKEIAVDFRSCLGSSCPLKGNCSYIQGLAKARDADIIIGNHALMFAWPKSLPRPSKIIVDEAHRLEHEATKAFEHTLSDHDLTQMVKAINSGSALGPLYYLIGHFASDPALGREEIAKIQNEFKYWVDDFSSHLEHLKILALELMQKRPKYSEIYWNEALLSEKIKGEVKTSQDFLIISFLNRVQSITVILSSWYLELTQLLSKIEEQMANQDDEKTVAALSRVRTFYQKIDESISLLKQIVNPEELWISILRFHQNEGLELCSIPVDIGKIMHQELLLKSQALVFTSATLGAVDRPTHGQVFFNRGVDWSLGHLFLTPEKRFKQILNLPAVYNYQKNCKVYFCSDVPELYDTLFVEKTLKKLIPLIRNLKGRSLLLYSSKVRFEEARERLLKELDQEIPVFIQGMGIDVINDFKKSPSGLLLGMESFGEGIDIPGEALQFVYIDKIPDLRQDLLTERRREFFEKNFGQEFSDYFLAHRSRSLLQKIGRLLRTTDDFGGVIITDARLKKWSKKTLTTFTEQISPYLVEHESLESATSKIFDFIEGHQNKPLKMVPEETGNFLSI